MTTWEYRGYSSGCDDGDHRHSERGIHQLLSGLAETLATVYSLRSELLRRGQKALVVSLNFVFFTDSVWELYGQRLYIDRQTQTTTLTMITPSLLTAFSIPYSKTSKTNHNKTPPPPADFDRGFEHETPCRTLFPACSHRTKKHLFDFVPGVEKSNWKWPKLSF